MEMNNRNQRKKGISLSLPRQTAVQTAPHQWIVSSNVTQTVSKHIIN